VDSRPSTTPRQTPPSPSQKPDPDYNQGFKNQTRLKKSMGIGFREPQKLKNSRFLFKTQNPKFINENQLISRFDQLVDRFSIKNSNTKT
jgi:hypothetical protein